MDLCTAELSRASGDDRPENWSAVRPALVGPPVAVPRGVRPVARGRGAAPGAATRRRRPWPCARRRPGRARSARALLVARIDGSGPPAADRCRPAGRRRRGRCDAEVAAAAPSAEPAAPADPFGLTSREREVLALVAEGWTNRRIADELFISESTAGVHVSHILAKLGVESRTEAATIAVRLGLDSGDRVTAGRCRASSRAWPPEADGSPSAIAARPQRSRIEMLRRLSRTRTGVVRRVRARHLAVPARRDVPDGRPALRLARGAVHRDPRAAPARDRRASGPNGRLGAPRAGAGLRRHLEAPASMARGSSRSASCADLPETDKAELRRTDTGCSSAASAARSPTAGTTIDESSGSTGTPYNWIRGRREREVAHRNIGFFARYAFGSGPLVTLNAFSMGAWAAGFNMSLGMMRHGIVKSIGPDIDKILSTLELPRADVSLPDLGLPAVPQAPARRGRAARLPVGRLRAPRAGRRRRHDRGAARHPARSASPRSTRATARPTSRSGWPANRR